MTITKPVVGVLMLVASPASDATAQGDDAHFHKNHVAIMVGGMTPLSETDHTSFALGAD